MEGVQSERDERTTVRTVVCASCGAEASAAAFCRLWPCGVDRRDDILGSCDELASLTVPPDVVAPIRAYAESFVRVAEVVRFVSDVVYEVLVEVVGATEDELDREAFRDFWRNREEYREYRFIGTLGFGGKFVWRVDRWIVTCYLEDTTVERDTAIEAANKRLAAIRSAVVGAGDARG